VRKRPHNFRSHGQPLKGEGIFSIVIANGRDTFSRIMTEYNYLTVRPLICSFS